jgi:hypothetical protein
MTTSHSPIRGTQRARRVGPHPYLGPLRRWEIQPDDAQLRALVPNKRTARRLHRQLRDGEIVDPNVAALARRALAAYRDRHERTGA